MSNPTAETVGEGFAYFAWHRLRWPYPCYCRFKRSHVCHREWTRGER